MGNDSRITGSEFINCTRASPSGIKDKATGYRVKSIFYLLRTSFKELIPSMRVLPRVYEGILSQCGR